MLQTMSKFNFEKNKIFFENELDFGITNVIIYSLSPRTVTKYKSKKRVINDSFFEN
jgi:hypothetical protein